MVSARLLSGTGVLVLSACASTCELKYAPASDVINAVKQELDIIQQNVGSLKIEVPKDSCGSPSDMIFGEEPGKFYVRISVNSLSAEVALKTVATDTATGAASGIKVPVGTVLISPLSAVTRTKIRTQQVKYSFNNHAGGGAQQQSNTTFKLRDDGSFVLRKGADILTPRPRVNSPYGIADAITSAVDQLLLVDHSHQPCIDPTFVTVQIDFQVQSKKEGKTDLGFLTLIDVQGDRISQNELAQSLVVTFNLTGSTTVNYESPDKSRISQATSPLDWLSSTEVAH